MKLDTVNWGLSYYYQRIDDHLVSYKRAFLGFELSSFRIIGKQMVKIYYSVVSISVAPSNYVALYGKGNGKLQIEKLDKNILPSKVSASGVDTYLLASNLGGQDSVVFQKGKFDAGLGTNTDRQRISDILEYHDPKMPPLIKIWGKRSID